MFYVNYMDAPFNCQASERLHQKMTGFVSRNKAAQIQNGSRLVKVPHHWFGIIGEHAVRMSYILRFYHFLRSLLIQFICLSI